MYACLGVTCHLHFWQNDRGLLRATAVTRGWKGHRIRISTEEKSPAAPAGIRSRILSITSPAFLPSISNPGNLYHQFIVIGETGQCSAVSQRAERLNKVFSCFTTGRVLGQSVQRFHNGQSVGTNCSTVSQWAGCWDKVFSSFTTGRVLGQSVQLFHNGQGVGTKCSVLSQRAKCWDKVFSGFTTGRVLGQSVQLFHNGQSVGTKCSAVSQRAGCWDKLFSGFTTGRVLARLRSWPNGTPPCLLQPAAGRKETWCFTSKETIKAH